MFNVVGPGLVSTSPTVVRSSASHPAGPHDRLAQNTVNRARIAGVGKVVIAPQLAGCVVWSQDIAQSVFPTINVCIMYWKYFFILFHFIESYVQDMLYRSWYLKQSHPQKNGICVLHQLFTSPQFSGVRLKLTCR